MVRDLARRPLAVAAAGWLLLVVVSAAGASVMAPDRPGTEDLARVLAGPSAEHWLGTDRLGRDVLSRLMSGSQVTLTGVAEALVVFAFLGTTAGLIGGFASGWPGRLIARLGDLILALPAIIVLLMVLAVFPGSDLATMIALGVVSCPLLLRVVRGSTLALRGELYIKAARVSGLSGLRIAVRHVLPRLAGPVIVQLSLFAATAVLVQSALSFLGLSTPETQGPSWGNMVAEASAVISRDPWLLVPTGAVLVLTVMALGLVGDAVRDVTAGRHLGALQPRRAQPATRPASRPPTVPSAGRLLSVRGLSVGFTADRGDVTVVRDVSFDLAPGEALGIVGESGCGKTVTARSLLGLLPAGGHITGGSALFGDLDLATASERDFSRIRGKSIALVSQDPMNGLDPSFRVGSQLAEVIRRHSPLTRRQAAARAAELLAMADLPEPVDTLSRYPHELSGGMAQRVSIALALAGEPRLLIADEPTTALDVTVQAEILALLRGLRDQLKMAIILVTHDWGVLADLCDRAVIMYAGEVVEAATVPEIYASPRHPYTEGLLAANPHLAPVTGTLPAIPGTVPPPSAWPAGCHFQPRCGYATEECGSRTIPVAAPAPGRLTRCIHSDKLAAAS
ncbi:MAG: dipeptide/oligopeptide/nickel ABC transporter permease/ATP-binding protein [Actinobacteria bacterium]|nr:dipeptide/oligopeptide/nickel ABC transporter permease/ATP-binding protein [Actinomycetota bacterium]MBO0784675.1 dipeptide/oligopeptide/nickel ABC transporter permease/ATP-binding protein [Actinomycetota bacterium]MBO0813577.1 dipeptide/oligopeptide/nickel ABC transporter permease/ATP-binding protein [Actinomycetota bacterium]